VVTRAQRVERPGGGAGVRRRLGWVVTRPASASTRVWQQKTLTRHAVPSPAVML
jgi:hypothetical protein